MVIPSRLEISVLLKVFFSLHLYGLLNSIVVRCLKYMYIRFPNFGQHCLIDEIEMFLSTNKFYHSLENTNKFRTA